MTLIKHVGSHEGFKKVLKNPNLAVFYAVLAIFIQFWHSDFKIPNRVGL